MAQTVEAPNEIYSIEKQWDTKIFLAGGISNCPDWQAEMIEKLKVANLIVFWFSKGSLNPIVLYELGMWGNSRAVTTVVGIDPEYERKQDVIIQTKLAKGDHQICNSLYEVSNAVKRFCSYKWEGGELKKNKL